MVYASTGAQAIDERIKISRFFIKETLATVFVLAENEQNGFLFSAQNMREFIKRCPNVGGKPEPRNENIIIKQIITIVC